jgi:Fe-S-cluster-containing dehydrogenase component
MITRRALLRLSGLSAVALTAQKATRSTASPRAEHPVPVDGENAAGEALPRERTVAAGSSRDGAQRTLRRVRWAMAIDLPRCQKQGDCDDCMVACHRAHNVPDLPDPRHRVRWLGKEPFGRVFPEQGEWATDALRDRPVPVTCNHCDDPPCVRVCPTAATWKRDDGIVAMDWHRCIGCKYCIVACPYGARSFNFVDPRPYVRAVNPDFPTRIHGVVEKCTLCAERLDAGQPPACVEACRAKAMVFGNLADPASPVRALLRRRFTIRRKPELGTGPAVFYVV